MKKVIRYSLPAIMLLSVSAQAISLKDVVKETINNNTEIQSSITNDKAFQYYVDEEMGGYFPKVDLTANISRKKTETKNSTTSTDVTATGHNIQLDVEQLIYDGGLTTGAISEAEHKYLSNKYFNANVKENVLLDSIKAYLNMTQAEEKIALTKANLSSFEEYLKIAQDNEAINGESLDKYQASAKVHFAKNRLLTEQNSLNSSVSSFERIVGMKPKGINCRPNIDKMSLPASTVSAARMALKQNYTILEQIENINEQRSVMNQASSTNLPTLKFKLQGIMDEDLISNNTETDIYTGKIELTYNLYNGGSDSSVTQREKLFLIEAQKVLDTRSNEVADNISVAFSTYETTQERILELEQYIKDNQEIVAIYKDQFEAGTRSFIDLLNVEGDLYNAKVSLVEAQYALYTAYYEIFTQLSTLEETVLSTNDQVCTEMKMKEPAEKEEEIKLN